MSERYRLLPETIIHWFSVTVYYAAFVASLHRSTVSILCLILRFFFCCLL